MRRVAVTGLGAVSPVGLDRESMWSSLCHGTSGIRAIEAFDATAFPSRIAGQCSGFDATQILDKRLARQTDRFIHFALAAAEQAVGQAEFEPDDAMKERVGTFIGVGLFGVATVERLHSTVLERGPSKVNPFAMPGMLSNLAPGQVSMRYGFKGPSYTHTSACASGAHAILDAARQIRLGEIDAAIAGGAEAAVTPSIVAAFGAMKALSTRNDDPASASRPYDVGRDGFVIGEGAGVLMLEEFEAARARGAKILAEVGGWGASSDAYHLTQPAPEGEGARRAMAQALAVAGVSAGDVDYVNAHGTSTGAGDLQESRAIAALLGAGACISSTKSMTGHLLGAAGGLEAVISCLALGSGVVPPTINLEQLDPEIAQLGLDIVAQTAREKKLRTVMSNSFGFGGTNCSLLFRAV